MDKRILTEEERTREKKYQEKYGEYVSKTDIWLTFEYWGAFEEIETFLDTYNILLKDYFEDLKYYALMYRDIDFANNVRYVDWHDIAFFAQRKNQIIDYKNRILTDCSLKAQVVRLYYDYEPMFVHYCCKILNIQPWKRFSFNNFRCTYEKYIEIKKGNLINRFGINQLTEEQCKIIIEHKSEIIDYISHNRNFFPIKEEENKFKKICSVFFESSNFERNAIINYINEKLPDEDINKTITFSKEKVDRILYLQDKVNDYRNCTDNEIKLLEESKPSLMDINVLWPLARIKEAKIEEAKTKKIISEINSKILRLQLEKQKKYKKEYNDLIEDLSHDSTISYIYENQHELNSYLSRYFEKCFKSYWLKDPQYCRTYFQRHIRDNTGYCIEHFLNLAEKGIKYKCKDLEIKLKFYFVTDWCRSVMEYQKEEREREKELERIEYEKRMEKFRFNKRNAHVLDKNIELRQSDHTYIVNDIVLDSVTTFVNNAFPKFDAEYHAKRKAEQLGISPKEVLEMWEKKGKESKDLGTTMHSKIEDYFLGNDSSETDAYRLFKIFANKVELKPYRTEWAVYDWEHKIAGTIDFVDNQNGEYIIYDWKRSEKVIENGMPMKINKYGEKGNYPLEHLDNTPYYHYALQLSLYKYILEKNYGMKISDLRLGIFHPAYNKPYVLRMPYLEKEINDIFNLRSEILF